MAENFDLQNFDWEAYENGMTDHSGKSKEELTALYDNTLNSIKAGEVVKGIVKGINKAFVVMPVQTGELREFAIKNRLFCFNLNKKYGTTDGGTEHTEPMQQRL